MSAAAIRSTASIIRSSCRPTRSALGASPKAIEAFKEVAGGLDIYPEGSAKLLRDAIAEFYGLDANRIVCGNGSDELLTMLANAYLRAGDELMFSDHGFLVYRIAALADGATPVIVPEKNLHGRCRRHAGRVTPKTRLVYLANPNNPTGAYLPTTRCAACMPACRPPRC